MDLWPGLFSGSDRPPETGAFSSESAREEQQGGAERSGRLVFVQREVRERAKEPAAVSLSSSSSSFALFQEPGSLVGASAQIDN